MQFIISNEDGINFSCHKDYEITNQESHSTYQSSEQQMVEEEFNYESTVYHEMIEALSFGFQSSAYEVIDVEQFQLREVAEGADN